VTSEIPLSPSSSNAQLSTSWVSCAHGTKRSLAKRQALMVGDSLGRIRLLTEPVLSIYEELVSGSSSRTLPADSDVNIQPQKREPGP
jgi:hypothetical protein